jgi:hypothetical protein
MNSDFKELLSLFNANNVEYLIVGGVAYIFYAEPRYTKDLDVWIKHDLITAKLAAGRPQDLLDVQSLRAEILSPEAFEVTSTQKPPHENDENK